MIMRVVTWLGLWLLLAILVGALDGRWCLNYYRLSRPGVAVEGVAREWKPHQEVGFSFEVNGRTYRGIGRSDIGGFGRISIGDKVPVYYLVDNPEVNCLGDPKQLYSAELPGLVGNALLFPTMIVCALIWRTRKHNVR